MSRAVIYTKLEVKRYDLKFFFNNETPVFLKYYEQTFQKKHITLFQKAFGVMLQNSHAPYAYDLMSLFCPFNFCAFFSKTVISHWLKNMCRDLKIFPTKNCFLQQRCDKKWRNCQTRGQMQ